MDKVDSVPADKKEVDMQIGFVLFERVSSELQHMLKGVRSGLEAWKKVSSYFQKSTFPRRVKAREEFYHVKHDASQPIHVYISAVEAAVQVLSDLGQKVSDTEILDLLMMNLDPSFHAIRTSLYTAEKEPSLATVKSILLGSVSSPLVVKSEPGDGSSTFAFATHQIGHLSGSRSGPSSEPGPEVGGFRWCDPFNEGHCHRCGCPGHVASKCIANMPQEVKDWIMAGCHSQHAKYVKSSVIESSQFAASATIDFPHAVDESHLPPLLT